VDVDAKLGYAPGVGQLALFVERLDVGQWELVEHLWVPKHYGLFAVLGETSVFGPYLSGRPALASCDGVPADASPEVLRAFAETSDEEDCVRHIGMRDLLDYAWDDGETTRLLAGALGFHRFETMGDTTRLLNPDRAAFAESLGLRCVSNEEMRAIIRERPEVLKDLVENAAGAYTFVEAKVTVARELGFEEALRRLRSCAPVEAYGLFRVTMIMSL
jgi:hypothetical protein